MAEIKILTTVDNKTAVEQITALKTSIEGVVKSLNSVSVNKDLTAQLQALTANYKALANAAKEAEKVNAKQQSAEDKHALSVAKVATEQAKATVQTARANTEKAKAEAINRKAAIAEDKYANSKIKSTSATKANTNANEVNRQSIASMVVGVGRWQIAMTLVMAPIRLVENALSSLNETLVETENKVIELQRVLPQGSATNKEIADTLYDISALYGQTFDNVSEIAGNFARTGMSWAETIEATKSAVLALNVAELDAEEATNGLIAIMSQFNLTATESELLVDKLNKTADNFPVTTEKLLTALQRTGSAAVNANASLDETIGIVTALSKATGRSGQNLGTAVNALMQYSGKNSALNIFAKLSEDAEKAVQSYREGGASIISVWEEVSKVITNADDRQKKILTELTETEDVQNLSQELHDELGDIFEQTQEVYGTANTFRKNYFISLLQNIQTAREAQKVAADAEGYSIKENEQYLETYTARVNTLKSEWEKLANDEQGILGLKKALADVGVGILDIVKGVGGLKTIIITVGTLAITYIATVKGAAIISAISKMWTTLASGVVVWKALAAGAVTFGTAVKTALPLVGLIASAVALLIGTINANKKTFDDIQNELNTTKSELDEITGKIQKNNEEIAKANKISGNQTYVKRLENENAELERQKELKEAIIKLENKELQEEAIDYLNNELTYAPTRIKTWYGNGENWGLVGNPIVAAQNMMDAYLDSDVSDETKNKIVKDLPEIIKNIEKYRKVLDTSDRSQKELYDSATDVIDAFNVMMNGEKLDTAEKEKNTKATEKLSKRLKKAKKSADDLTTSFTDTKEALSTITKAVKDFDDNGKVSFSTLQSLQDKFGDVKGIDKYIDKLAEGDITADELQSTLNELTNEYINSKISSGELYGASENVIRAMLDEVGVVDSATKAHEIYQRVQANALATQIDSTATADELSTAIKNGANACDMTSSAFANLVAKEIIFNNTDLSVEDKIKKLGELQSALGMTGALVNYAQTGDLSDLGITAEGTTSKIKPPKGVNARPKINYTRTYTYKGKTYKTLDDAMKAALNDQYKNSEFGKSGGSGADSTYSFQPKTSDDKKNKQNKRETKIETEIARYNLYETQGKSAKKLKAQAEKVVEAEKKWLSYSKKHGATKKEILDIEKDIADWETKIKDIEKKQLEKSKQKKLDKISELEATLNLQEKSGASESERIKTLNKIKKKYQELETWMKKNGYSQKEINEYLEKELDTTKQISEIRKGLKEEFGNKLLSEAEKLRDSELEKIEKQREELKKQREEQEDINEALEKEKELRQALLDLENAKSNLTTRYFNPITGQYERTYSGQSVKSAEEALENAQKGYQDYIANKNYDAAEKALDNAEDKINKAYDTLSEKINAKLNPDNSRSISALITEMLKSGIRQSTINGYTGLWNNFVNTIGTGKKYDNGGVLYGIGGIKATNKPESVLNPQLTAQLLKPSTNENFERFANSLGIMLGACEHAPTTNITKNTNTSNTDNRNYTVNGIPITQTQAEKYTVADILKMAENIN